ncbi:NosD domain-containing protein [Brevibacillus borstelensis]|uniref:right-handed parallel beta-helix repeat-containing protein n=2 Tax=Brevibacillus TaxID=55080 RepID=UPI00046973BB|nr:NosD domain-containing protein [Brevibacillus borstelensis]MCM3624888.1 right-handed parallel beta-helix repeat-containing protein [Brevibacillus borstelensis]MED1876078.1 NosD domain-containing protein [Brevibacillus borstelensis]NOU56582.1 ABC transporter substrate-binding protein [Brevibacillus borstelensis]RNB59547.1 ABC transporter substrate-binding protein [Brevibacillus borstelensis]WNF05798.1 NosD domain-containing protein [Brevibacillus borstelensis]
MNLQRVLWRLFIAAFAVAAVSIPGKATAATSLLQELIDQAKPGETVLIPAGAYQGPVRVTKPIKLLGQGTVEITSTGKEPALVIQTDHTTVRGIRIVDKRINEPDASVIVKGSYNVLEQLVIETMGTGMQLIKADHNILKEIAVIGGVDEPDEGQEEIGHDHSQHKLLVPKSTGPKPQKGNGINLDQSHYNQLTSNRIGNMFDGVYLENSNFNTIEQNFVEKSRYGYHFMGTADTKLLGNTGSANVTGAMLMETTRATVKENRFVKQRENPNSQGILLFDVTQSQIENNLIEGNRVGLFMEQSSENLFKGNQLEKNFIGMQLKEAAHNEVTANQFISNVIQGQAQASKENLLEGNYWDTMQGIDLDGDQHSDIPYEMNPFFLALTGAVPPYQLFFQAPGFVFLEGLFTSGTGTAIRDPRPLMAPAKTVLVATDGILPAEQTEEQPEERTWVMSISACLLALTSLGIYMGVRQK